MFTGIIEDIGVVKSVEKQGVSGRIAVRSRLGLKKGAIGESIAVDGVCLTVAAVSGDVFVADLSQETLSRSTLGALKANDRVNLERAVTLNKPLGGHIVTGHIDGTAEIKAIAGGGGVSGVGLNVSAGADIMRYIVEKGPVAVDGISLTIASLDAGSFCVAVIPHTLEHTTLGCKKRGSKVNIEIDIIGKYVERFLTKKTVSNITEDYLKGQGFLKRGR